ncbi:MAG: InlB B-repeat-containing protein [Clostridia bacterium]|nr:InlB B-repeat-containing protein [Clostridia bacterium]
MRKLVRVCSVILFLLIFQLNFVDAKKINIRKYNNIRVYIDGQVSIDTQINGASQDYNNVVVDISDISVEIEDNNQKKIYTNFNEQTQQGSVVKKYYKDVDPFSEDAILTVNGKIKSEELNLNVTFSKMYLVEDLLTIIDSIINYDGCNIRITSEEVKNIITYDVVFKTEEGGKFSDGLEYIEHVNIISGEKYPNIPEVISNQNYKFLGWYDEETGLKINEFPSKVTKDLTAVAKWKLIEQEENLDTIETVAIASSDDKNIIVLDNNNLQALDSYTPPRTAVDNNMTLLIVFFIISSTVTIGLGCKILRQD